jgi:cytochrome b
MLRRLIWPWPIRVLHWLLALGVIVSWVTHEVDGPWHEWPGYLALGAALLRFSWGCLPATREAPARYSRFGDFLRGPGATWKFFCRVLQRQAPRHLGHNPVAGWLIVGLLVVTIVAGLTGWMQVSDRFFGVGWVIALHNVSGHAIVPLVLLHWIVIAYQSRRHQENLIASMFHGQKTIRSGSGLHRPE